MPDRAAQQLERLMKQAAGEYRKASLVPEAVELVNGERADISLVSTESVDREGDVVLAKGIGLDMFQANPVVTFAHAYDQLPVGKAQWVKKVSGGLRAKTVYATKPDAWSGDWFPDAVFSLVQQGILKGKSIGFLPLRLRAPTEQEVRQRPEWKNARGIVEESLLLEYAIAPVPVNQDALVESVSKGLANLAALKLLGIRPQRQAVNRQAKQVATFTKAIADITLDPEIIADQVINRLLGKI